MRLSYFLMTIACLNQNVYGVCLNVDVSHDLFHDPEPEKVLYTHPDNVIARMDPSKRFIISSQFYNDIRTRYVPFTKDNWAKNPITQEIEPTQDALEENSPYYLVIEYSGDKSTGILTQKHIKNAGLIEECHMVDREIRPEKGSKEQIRQLFKGNKFFRQISVFLKFRNFGIKEIDGGYMHYDSSAETKIDCGRFSNIAPSQIDISIYRKENKKDKYDKSTQIICEAKPHISQ